MNLLTIKKRASHRHSSTKKSRWLRLPSEFFGITGIFSMDKPIHPLADLLRQAFFNRYHDANIPYAALEHFSALIYRRWSIWPEAFLIPIFERLEIADESDIKACGAFPGWIEKEIRKDIGFQEFVVGVGKQTLEDLLFDAAVEQARGSPNERFNWVVWSAAENLPEKVKMAAKKESLQCQDYNFRTSSSSNSLIGLSDKNGRPAIKSIPSPVS